MLKTKIFLPNTGHMTRMPILITPIQHHSKGSKQEDKKEKTRGQKGEIKGIHTVFIHRQHNCLDRKSQEIY